LCSDGAAVAEADVVVLASGAALGAFTQTAWLPLELSRGQMEWGPAEGATPSSVVEGGPYLAPMDGGVAFGATFDRMGALAPVTPDAESRARNLAALYTLDADLAARVNAQALTSRAAVRTALPNRTPLAGAAPDADAREDGAVHDGLWLLGGLGSRGFLAAPLLGETVACAILGEPQALDAEALAAVDPARFLRRMRRRGALA
jgi:tRNA 5-methylaminomethyl-2-thiouridine biosynthesis bifunctional protein